MGSQGLARRRLLQGGVAGLGLLAGCGVSFGPAATPAGPRRIGWLANGTATVNMPQRDAFRQRLRELGYVEGQDVVFEERYAEGREDRLAALAAELVESKVDLILTAATPGIRAATQATTTIPIVFASAPADPVAEGLIASMARPGGNATGLTLYAGEEHAKRLQLFKEAVPGVSRVAVLWTQTGAGVSYLREIEAAAPTLGVEVVRLELQSPDALDTVLEGATAGRADGLVVTAGPLFSFLAARIVGWAAAHRLPAIYAISTFAEPGGLLVYAASLDENYRHAADYVDKIFKGAKPGDLPVEKPTTFDFVNLKTAQPLGLTIPQSVLAQATQVIQ
jgi:putative ABC transport system substrate-binding protein